MPRYRQIKIDGKWTLIDVSSCRDQETNAPYVIGDTPDYTSPIDGRLISGRKQRREDLKRNHCVEYDPGMKDDAKRFRAEQERRFDRSLRETMERTAIQLRDGMVKKETKINAAWMYEK
jgi:hypothetical protein